MVNFRCGRFFMISTISRLPLPERPLDWDTISQPQPGLRGFTYSYFRSDEASSASQKAVRRCYPEEAVQWCLELFWTGQAAKTNIWNRALVMAIEDVGPANSWLVSQVWSLVTSNKDHPTAMAIAALLLARSRKCRVNDWAVKIVPELNQPAVADAVGTPQQLQELLIDGLHRKHIGTCLYAAKALFFTTRKISGKYKNAQWLIWTAFDQIIGVHPDCREYLETIKSVGMIDTWRWTKKCRLLHIHIIHLWCVEGRWPLSSQRPNLTISLDLQQEALALTQRYHRREGLVGVPDYALDKHTQRGKSMGRGLEHFIKEGSLLVDVDPDWEPLSAWYLAQIG